MGEQAQNQAPQAQEMDVAWVAAEATRVAAESSLQSHTAWEPDLQGEIGQVTTSVRELGDEVARMLQECDR